MDLDFNGRVVVVTGAGNGLGRSHAKLFAKHGARVVVNDLGGDPNGGGGGTRAADAVVQEIREAGGEAVANYDSVVEGAKIVQTALDTYRQIDVVVNNAGILRDVTFHKMSPEDWDLVYQVHVLGAMRVTYAAWPHLREQRYGRVINTASAAGIYGNFGQSNYSMAKLGLHGFTNTLALEGRNKGVNVNTIAPLAGSRLTESLLPPDLLEALDPAHVSPLVVWLCHESCDETGGLFEVGGGYFGKLRWERAEGKMWRLGRTFTPEMVRDAFDTITDFDGATHPTTVTESLQPIVENVQRGPTRGGNRFIDVDEALGYRYPERTSSYDERDLALYALGIGAAQDPNGPELSMVYESHGEGFRAAPSYGVVLATNEFLTMAREGITAPGTHYGLDRLLHGEQMTKLERPLPPKATLTHRARITNIYDKGKGALIETTFESFDEDGDLLVTNVVTAFIRGAGGWGGDRGPTGEVNPTPDRDPDFVVEERTSENQALLYRLSGDWNPLHVDPNFAQAVGYERPILHGLCTLGFATRHVLSKCAPDGDPRYFESIKVRFAKTVFPGETLVTEMWKEGHTVIFQTKVKERDEVVLSNAAVTLYETIPKKAPKPKADPVLSTGPTSADYFKVLRSWLSANAETAKAVGKVYRFALKDPDADWTLDLREATLTAGGGAKPDCTLELAQSNLIAMLKGEKDATKMYFGGDLKVSGDVMASQRLDFLGKVDFSSVTAGLATTAPSPVASPTRDAFAPGFFAALNVTPATDRILTVNITEPDGTWTIDFGAGTVQAGAETSANTVITLTDKALEQFVRGEEHEVDLYQRGALRVDGQLDHARDLSWMKGA
ncbi:MAG: SDR family NAD(P)-dependent oxidoreductase [Myxococcota bacterium]